MSLKTVRGKIWLLVLIGVYSLILNSPIETDVAFEIIATILFVGGILIIFGLSEKLGVSRTRHLFFIHSLAIAVSSLWPAFKFGSVMNLFYVPILYVVLAFITAAVVRAE